MLKKNSYEDVEISIFNELIAEKGFIAIITATDLETEELHCLLRPLPNKEFICKIYGEELTYYAGVMGKYKVVHTQCGMGTSSRSASIATTSKLITEISPKLLIMVGIAFGVDKIKQQIGDVLISESIQPYENQRVGDTSTNHRADTNPASNFILNRLKSLKTSWNFPLDEDGKKSNLLFGQILSGEKLIDNEVYRDNLVDNFPNAIGGEMEGAGIASSCDGKVEWVLIKGICDFADGNKSINKESNQRIASQAALSILSELFSSPNVFKIKDVFPIENNSSSEKLQSNSTMNRDILFDVYKEDFEKYYIERAEDIKIQSLSQSNSVWVFGKSGAGKSSIILRNTIKAEHVFISLSSCIDDNSDDFFIEILDRLAEKCNESIESCHLSDFKKISHKIIEVLKHTFQNKVLAIVIDEIPIDDEPNKHKEFTRKLIALIINVSLQNELREVKFILSSINSPKPHIENNQRKIHEKMIFLEIDYWLKEDILKLYNLIEEELGIKIEGDIKNSLLNSNTNSPRFFKTFFRNLINSGDLSPKNQQQMLLQTKNDLRL